VAPALILKDAQNNQRSPQKSGPHTVGAIETLVKVHKNPKAPFPARVAAAEAILSRGWGRPSGDFEGGEALVIKVVKFAEQQLEDTEIKTIEHIPNADDQSPV
jgi:hypothetical protein